MAGGVGTRFWPESRIRRPKQLLPIVSKKTMLQETIGRIKTFVPEKRILIVTSVFQKPLLQRLLKSFPKRNILAEPCSRNTAPCLGLAALYIERQDPEAIFIALPADHRIQDAISFRRHLKVACQLASENHHVVFGIPPLKPHTGYGYIASQGKTKHRRGVEFRQGLRFIEKPPLRRARAFVRSGKYFWNSGMFVWKLSYFLRCLEKTLPDLSRKLFKLRAIIGTSKEKSALRKTFSSLPHVSIDYGLMEKVKKLYIVMAKFGWSDVGSWHELEGLLKRDRWGNAFRGNVISVRSERNIVRAGGRRLISLLGVQDLIIVDTEDALLVCRKDNAQEVKKLVDLLRRKKLHRYL